MNFGSHLIDALCNAFIVACASIVFVVFVLLGAGFLSVVTGTTVSPFLVAFCYVAVILIVAYIYWHRQKQERKREAAYYERIKNRDMGKTGPNAGY